MLAKPELSFDLTKIKQNICVIREICEKQGIVPCFVTKGFCAAPEIIQVVYDAGIRQFGDSRLQNIQKIRRYFSDIDVMLIREPSPAEAEDVVLLADSSIQSDVVTVREISKEALRHQRRHAIYIDIDVGDLRDGLFTKEQIYEFVQNIKDLPGISIKGVFTNVGCYGSIMPSKENASYLAELKEELNREFGLDLQQVSFGGTVAFPMIMEGKMPKGVNHFRFAECALFGEDTTGNRPIEGLHKDAVLFSAPVVEKIRKPSVPIGERGKDAYGNVGEYPQRGTHTRVILGAGKQDVAIAALSPLDEKIILVGASSDHIILDVEDAAISPSVGDYVTFRCGYMAMLYGATSEFVDKKY